jgi:hypothetical protein
MKKNVGIYTYLFENACWYFYTNIYLKKYVGIYIYIYEKMLVFLY